MALDKLVDSGQLNSDLTSIANAIRAKTGDNSQLAFPSGFTTAIGSISTGSGGSDSALTSLIDRSITSIESDVTSIGSYAFHSCTRLTDISFPAATSISSSAFQNCAGLTTASFPAVTSIGSYAFHSCTRLTDISFPKATSIGNNAFQSCSRLIDISFPAVTNIGGSAFQSCSRLIDISFPKVTSIGGYAFYSCTGLTSVILGQRATLANANVFQNANKAIVYVQPEDLEWYSTATNWSTLYSAGRVKSVAELPS